MNLNFIRKQHRVQLQTLKSLQTKGFTTALHSTESFQASSAKADARTVLAQSQIPTLNLLPLLILTCQAYFLLWNYLKAYNLNMRYREELNSFSFLWDDISGALEGAEKASLVLVEVNTNDYRETA